MTASPNPTDADLPDLVSRWAVRLDEPRRPDTPTATDSPLHLFTLDVPPRDFQPRLSRFDEAA